MSTAASVFAPEIESCGSGESLTGSLNVAVMVTVSPDLYGPGVEQVMAAVGFVLSKVNDLEAEFAVFPAISDTVILQQYVVPETSDAEVVSYDNEDCPKLVTSGEEKSELSSIFTTYGVADSAREPAVAAFHDNSGFAFSRDASDGETREPAVGTVLVTVNVADALTDGDDCVARILQIPFNAVGAVRLAPENRPAVPPVPVVAVVLGSPAVTNESLLVSNQIVINFEFPQPDPDIDDIDVPEGPLVVVNVIAAAAKADTDKLESKTTERITNRNTFDAVKVLGILV